MLVQWATCTSIMLVQWATCTGIMLVQWATCTSIMLVQWATCTSIMLVQWTNTINIQISVLVYYKVNIIISLNVACSCNDIHVAENCSFWHQATIIHTTIFQLHLCGQHIIPLYPVYQCSSIDVHNLFFRQIVVSQMLNTFVFHTACTVVYIFDFRFTRLKGTCRYFHLFSYVIVILHFYLLWNHWANWNPSKNQRWTQVLQKGKQLLLHIWPL